MDISITELWQPIILGAVLAWVASGVIHMVVKYHNADYLKLSNEDEVSAALKNSAAEPGIYSLPYCDDPGQMSDEGLQKKFIDGPVAFVAIFENGLPNMGKLLFQQFAFFLLGCVLIGYCATLGLSPGADYLTVFRFVATLGFIAFGWGVIPYSIWYGHSWATAGRYLVDAIVYGLIVAGAFSWLWPAGLSA